MRQFQPAHARPFIAAALAGAVLATAPQAASAHDPAEILSGAENLGHQGDGLEVKRVKQSGKGLPSVRGPFPDTVNMEFLGQLTNAELGATRLISTGSTFLSDIWGWTSPDTGDEYAIVGTNSGVAFARVTDADDPAAPVPEYLGIVFTLNPNTTLNFWWDMKTYEDYLYFTTEVLDSGLGIFSMKDLDGREAVEAGTPDAVLFAEYWNENGFRAAHNISINEETGFAYLTGVTKDQDANDAGFVRNGMIVLDLKPNLLEPVEKGQVVGFYAHDAHVVNYEGPDGGYTDRQVAAVFNGDNGTLGIYDVTDLTGLHNVATNPGDEIVISETPYGGASFTHQGWFTEDHAFLLMGDEEDEYFGLMDPQNPLLPDTARTYVWNVQNLENPTVVHRFDSDAASIDHNLFVRNEPDGREFVYQANYTAGIRVTELTRTGSAGPDQVATLQDIAHMDTEPRLQNQNMNLNWNIFEGPWGVYPYFGSGKIIASDGLNGLIVMKLDLAPTP